LLLLNFILDTIDIKPIIEIVKVDTDKNLLQGGWRKYTGHWLSRNDFNNNDNGFDFSAGGMTRGKPLF
jgi:hypothetical protein